MCLYSLGHEEVATCDIPCVKLLAIDSDGKYYTPFYKRRVSQMVLRGLSCLRAKGKKGIFVSHLKYCTKTIKGGYIHVYASQADAHEQAWFGMPRYVLYDCVIPKGTRYWKSYDGCEYAARKIRFIQEIKDVCYVDYC